MRGRLSSGSSWLLAVSVATIAYGASPADQTPNVEKAAEERSLRDNVVSQADNGHWSKIAEISRGLLDGKQGHLRLGDIRDPGLLTLFALAEAKAGRMPVAAAIILQDRQSVEADDAGLDCLAGVAQMARGYPVAARYFFSIAAGAPGNEDARRAASEHLRQLPTLGSGDERVALELIELAGTYSRLRERLASNRTAAIEALPITISGAALTRISEFDFGRDTLPNPPSMALPLFADAGDELVARLTSRARVYRALRDGLGPLRSKQYDEARALLEKALTDAQRGFDRRLEANMDGALGGVASQQHEYRIALQHVIKEIRVDRELKQVVTLGFALTHFADIFEKISSVNDSLDLTIDFISAVLGPVPQRLPGRDSMCFVERTAAQIRQNRFAEALGNARRAIAADPRNPQAYHVLASVFRRGQLFGSIPVCFVLCTTALRLDPLLRDVRDTRARLFFETKVKDSSREEANRAFSEAQRAFSDGRLEEARSSYEKAIESDPLFVAAHLYLGDVFYRLRQFEQALPHFERAVRLDPTFAQARRFYVDAIREMNDVSDILVLPVVPDPLGERAGLWERLRHQADDGELWYRLGEVYLSEDLVFPALYAFHQACDHSENNVDTLISALRGLGVAMRRFPLGADHLRQVAFATIEDSRFREVLNLRPDDLYARYDFVIADGARQRALLLNAELLTRGWATLPTAWQLGDELRSPSDAKEAVDAYNRHDYRSALRHAETAIQAGARPTDLLLLAGCSALRMGRVFLANQYFEESALSGARGANLAAWQGVARAFAGNTAEAAESFDRALELGVTVFGKAELDVWKQQVQGIQENDAEKDTAMLNAMSIMSAELQRRGVVSSDTPAAGGLSASEWVELTPPLRPILDAPDKKAKLLVIQDLPAEDRPFIANLLTLAAYYYEHERNLDAALLYVELARENADRIQAGDPPSGYSFREFYQGEAAIGLGDNLLARGELLQARKEFGRAMGLFDTAEQLRLDHCVLPSYAEYLDAGSRRLQVRARLDEVARQLNEPAQHAAFTAGRELTAYELVTHSYLSDARRARQEGNFEVSFRSLDYVARRIGGTVIPAQGRWRAEVAQEFGVTLNKAGLHLAAIHHLEHAVTLNARPDRALSIGGEGRPPATYVRTYGQLGAAHEALGQTEEATRAYRDALRFALRSPQISLAATVRADDMIDPELAWPVLQALGNLEALAATKDSDPKSRRASLDRAVHYHRQAIDVIESTRRKLTDSVLEQTERTRLGYIHARGAPYRSIVAVLANRALAERDEASVKTSVQFVERAKAQVLVDLLSERKVISPVLAATALEGLADWLRVQKAVLIEYFAVEDRVFVWCVGDPRRLWRIAVLERGGAPVLPPALEADARAFVAAISTESTSAGEIRSKGHDLSQVLLPAAMRDAVQQAAVVYIVPHGALHLVPFRALPNFGSASGSSARQVVEPSAGLLWALVQEARQGQQPGAGRLYAVLNPAADAQLMISRQRQELPTFFPPPASQHVETATGTDVLRAVRSFDYVHVFSHGYFDVADPLKSYLELSDGRLSAADIYRFADEDRSPVARRSVITLVACETGKGQVLVGDEVLGLPRAFLHAGARSLLTTLWRTNPQFSDRLVSRFYEKVSSGESTSVALPESLKEVIAMDPRYTHPFFWASFVLVGDPH